MLAILAAGVWSSSGPEFRNGILSANAAGHSVAKTNLSVPKIPSHPNHSTQNQIPSASGVDVYSLHSSEPAPMGIADYGIGSSGAYGYSTSSFLGIARVYSLTTQNLTGDPSMSFQLNAVLEFTTNNGQQFVYWIQDVAQYYTNNSAIYFLDNVWNLSSSSAQMSSSGILGNGQVTTYSGGRSYYYDRANTYSDYLSLPNLIGFKVDSSINSQNEPQVSFEYNYQGSWQTYDTVSFPELTSPSLDAGFVVDGTRYNPYRTFYDAELILGGESGGWNTTDIQSNVELQLQFWNGHNFQEIYNAYNFGSNTAEGISNVESHGYYLYANGSLEAQILSGAGGLGKLYDQTQVSMISVQSNISSGSLYMINDSYSSTGLGTGYQFTGGDVNVTVAPGTYAVYLYNSNGVLVANANETLTAGQYLPLQVTSSSSIPITLSYSTVGGSPLSPPTITYYLNGQKIVAKLSTSPTTIYVDPGSSWSVSNEIAGSSQSERWETYQGTLGTASSAQTVEFVYYHQYGISFGYTVVGGGGGMTAPNVDYTEFGNTTVATATTSFSQIVWVDAGSSYSYDSQIGGSSNTERWIVSHASMAGSVSTPQEVSATYYHQFLVSSHISILDGGDPRLAINLTQFGLNVPLRPNSSVWVDAGSPYSFPQILAG